MRIKNVLAPVDFSPASRVAVNHAISLARKFRAKLTLLHVIESPSGFPHPFVENERMENEHRDQAWRMLSALVAPEDEDDLDLQIVTKSGDIEAQIASAIKEYEADIVVMGTHGRGLVGRWVIGSVTQSVLRKIPVPILSVSRVTRPLTFKHILYATDLSSTSDAGFEFALELARMMGSDLIVVHAVDRSGLSYGASEMTGYFPEGRDAEARKALADLIAKHQGEKIKIAPIIIEGNAADGILKVAEENAVDLILMTIQRKGILERALIGSTAERVIREAHVPVFSIPAQ